MSLNNLLLGIEFGSGMSLPTGEREFKWIVNCVELDLICRSPQGSVSLNNLFNLVLKAFHVVAPHRGA